ncbi:MAG: hypothetical protein JO267_08225 [Alphaproteobacteria bacterium]|nr:hypothetical protein [Alphaproteobacteria bacterium]MBV9862122.1 hypothetical protein [Alphaproteobacteria bacterium]
MTQLRLALLAMTFSALAGCNAGAPERASDIQNLNGVTDDISAVTMTESDHKRAQDPNMHSTIPRTYETFDTP